VGSQRPTAWVMALPISAKLTHRNLHISFPFENEPGVMKRIAPMFHRWRFGVDVTNHLSLACPAFTFLILLIRYLYPQRHPLVTSADILWHIYPDNSARIVLSFSKYCNSDKSWRHTFKLHMW
jgi:hypothetical protein